MVLRQLSLIVLLLPEVVRQCTPSRFNQTSHLACSHDPSADRLLINENEGCVDFLFVQKTYLNKLCFCRAFATHPEDSSSLQCNTEKDKERLHHRTAGSVDTQHIIIPYLSIPLLIM